MKNYLPVKELHNALIIQKIWVSQETFMKFFKVNNAFFIKCNDFFGKCLPINYLINLLTAENKLIFPKDFGAF